MADHPDRDGTGAVRERSHSGRGISSARRGRGKTARGDVQSASPEPVHTGAKAAREVRRWLYAPGGRHLFALIAVTAVTMLAIAAPLYAVLRAGVNPGPEIALPPPAHFDDPALTNTESHGAEALTEQGAAPAAQFDWHDSELVRRAAGILLLDGDYDGAMELLAGNSRSGGVAIAAGRSASRELIDALVPSLIEEWRALRKFWVNTDRNSRGFLFGRAEQHMKRRCAVFLAASPEAVNLLTISRSLPSRLAVVFMSNVHVRVAEASGAQDTLVALVVGLGLPVKSAASRMYWERLPRERTSYGSLLKTAGARRAKGGSR